MEIQLWIWKDENRDLVTDVFSINLSEANRMVSRFKSSGLDNLPFVDNRVYANLVVINDDGSQAGTYRVVQGHLPRGCRNARACISLEGKRVVLYESFIKMLKGRDVSPPLGFVC